MLTEPIMLYFQTLTCVSMTSLIWQIQVNHYPSFEYVDKERFTDFAHFHVRRITPIVAPLMIIELITSVLLLMLSPKNPWYILNTLGVAIIWFATQFLSIPCHNKLIMGFDLQSIKKLVKTNWIRTILWTARSILLITLAFKGT